MASTATGAELARPRIAGLEVHPLLPDEAVARLAADMELIQTEDNQAVDNILSAMQMQFLTETLYQSWRPTKADGTPLSFIALANVGLFYAAKQPPIVPDVMVATNVEMSEGFNDKTDLTYFAWDYGKVPDLAIEIVSPAPGGEEDEKMARYAGIGVRYYVIFDPMQWLKGEVLRVYRLVANRYELLPDCFLSDLGLGLKLWEGTYEGKKYHRWLRWCDRDGVLLPTGDENTAREAQRATRETERAERELKRAEREAKRADREAKRADHEAKRAAELAAKLRALGIDPDEAAEA